MDRLVARNVFQSTLSLQRAQADWLAEAATNDEVAALSTTSAPAADDVREIAGAILGRIRSEILPPAA